MKAYCDLCDKEIELSGQDAYLLSDSQMLRIFPNKTRFESHKMMRAIFDRPEEGYEMLCEECVREGYSFFSLNIPPVASILSRKELTFARHCSLAWGRGEPVRKLFR